MSARVTLRANVVEIDIEDGGDCFDLEQRIAAGPRSEGGRGLAIVRSLADSFSVRHADGTTCKVTATVSL